MLVFMLDVAHTTWEDADIKTNLSLFLTSVLAARPPKVDPSLYIKQVSISGGITPGVILPRKALRVSVK